MSMNAHQRIARLAEDLEVALPSALLEPLARFDALVDEWSRRVDLVSTRDPAARAEILFADALVTHAVADLPAHARLLDVGAGVGAPTLPLLLLREDLQACLVEPRRKRVAFLRTALGSLGLERRSVVIEGKIDPEPGAEQPLLRGASFDIACSRATFAPERWLPLGLGLASWVLVFTAQRPPPTAPGTAELCVQHSYALPSSQAPRHLGVYRRRLV